MIVKILCPAIWYIDLPTQKYPPKNIDKGLVVCGHRHTHCIDVVKALSDLRTVQFGEGAVGKTIQGFLTNDNRFVNRMEAMEIAYQAGQVEKEKWNSKKELFSEDLY